MSVTAQNVKVLGVIAPVAIVDNASWTTIEIDTRGFDYCQVYCYLGFSDIAGTALKMQESSVTGTSFTDISGLVYGTSTNVAGSSSTLPSATDDGLIFGFDIDLRGRKRFLDLVATGGDGSTGAFMSAIAILSRGLTVPMSTAERGFTQLLRV